MLPRIIRDPQSRFGVYARGTRCGLPFESMRERAKSVARKGCCEGAFVRSDSSPGKMTLPAQEKKREEERAARSCNFGAALHGGGHPRRSDS